MVKDFIDYDTNIHFELEKIHNTFFNSEKITVSRTYLDYEVIA
jgi:hypothetical protein